MSGSPRRSGAVVPNVPAAHVREGVELEQRGGPAQATPRVYTSKSYRALAVLAVAFIAGLTTEAIGLAGMDASRAAIAGTVAALAAGLVWRAYWLTQVRADALVLVVVNPFTEYVVPYQQVEGISTRQHLALRLTDKSLVRVWCLQAANFSLMFGTESHINRVARELRSRRDASSTMETARSEVCVRRWRPNVVVVALVGIVGAALGVVAQRMVI